MPDPAPVIRKGDGGFRLWTTAPPPPTGYAMGMDDEPPLTEDERAWLAELLHDTGPQGARLLADLLGLDDA